MSQPSSRSLPPAQLAGRAAEICLGSLVLSTVLERIGHGEALVRQPLLEGMPARLPLGSRVRLIVPAADTCWEVTAEVDTPQQRQWGEGLRLRCQGEWRERPPRLASRLDRRLAVELVGASRDGSQRSLCITRNISETGFATVLESGAEVAPGLLVEALLFFTVWQPPLRLTARCVRHRHLHGRLRGRVEAGFEFVGLSEDERATLRKAITARLSPW